MTATPDGLPLKERIQEDVKGAMRARDKERLGVLRMISADIKQKEVDDRTTLDDAGVLAVLDRMAKQRRDALAQFRAAGRDDLAEREAFELELIESYLPQALTPEELAEVVKEVVASTSAASMQDMGRVMGALRPRVQGRADMGEVSRLVKERLGAR